MIKIAINKKHKGKHPPGLSENAQKAWFRWYNAEFENVELSLSALAKSIQKGHGYTTQHRDYRKAANFICGHHIAIDADNLPGGTTLQDIVNNDPFIAKYAALLHTTASHGPHKTKARVIFVFDKPLPKATSQATAQTALTEHYSQIADSACKDACRLFFGAPGCEVLVLGNVLPIDVFHSQIVAPWQTAQEQKDRQRLETSKTAVVVDSDKAPSWLLESHAQKLLERVSSALDGEKYHTLRNVSRAFGGYVAAGYYDEWLVVGWLENAISRNPNNVKSLSHAKSTIGEAIQNGKKAPLYFELKQQEKQQCQRPGPGPEPNMDSSWQDDILHQRLRECEALIMELPAAAPAWSKTASEYYRINEALQAPKRQPGGDLRAWYESVTNGQNVNQASILAA